MRLASAYQCRGQSERHQEHSGRGEQLGITIKKNGDEPVGSIALKPVSHYTIDPVEANDALRERYGRYLGGNALELGYWIGRPFWGRGFMTEALNAVLGYVFDTLRKDAVWGGHYRENMQSGRVMAKCGMRDVGESRHRYFPLIDAYHDEVLRIITAGKYTQDRA